jgi:hypothetical protein
VFVAASEERDMLYDQQKQGWNTSDEDTA